MEVNDPIDIRPGDIRCPRCYGRDIAPSMPRGILDAIMRRRLRIPKHCRFCGKRFYVLAPRESRDEDEDDE